MDTLERSYWADWFTEQKKTWQTWLIFGKTNNGSYKLQPDDGSSVEHLLGLVNLPSVPRQDGIRREVG